MLSFISNADAAFEVTDPNQGNSIQVCVKTLKQGTKNGDCSQKFR